MALRSKPFRSENVQAELDDLQRKYRIMELTRRTHTDDPQNAVRMQRQQIAKLKKDNDRLKEDLALETRQARTANNVTASTQIAKLQDQGDMYARKIEAEKKRLEELDRQIKKMEATILLQRKEMGGINASKENNQAVQKSIRILENRLDKALVKFNEALAHNKQLRETIDNLRRERVVFDGIYKKLERELQEKKAKMAEIIEVSNAAYEARDQAQQEMLVLKSQADREQQKFEEKWATLGNLIDEDRKMKDFMKLKDTQHASAKTEAVDPVVEEEQRLRRRVNKAASDIARDKAQIHAAMEKVRSYEEAFAKIQQATNISDIDQLVQTFISAEDQNFALFNKVNDLSNEIEKLEEGIAEVQEQIKQYQGQGVNVDNQRKKILTALESKLTQTESKAQRYEKKHTEAMQTISALKDGIADIFAKVGAPSDAVVPEALNSAGVTESNMIQYLGWIEQRTQELLQEHARQQAVSQQNQQAVDDNDNDNDNALNAEVELPTTIALPNAGFHDADDDDESDNGDDERPMTIEEMNRMTQRHSG
jgi:coiled-coil domain-containing protein 63/114